MTTREFNNTIATINKFIAGNNPVAASAVLKQYYSGQLNSPDQIEKVLNSLYGTNQLNYFSVVKQIPYNFAANNWTTSSSSRQALQNIATQLGKTGGNHNQLDLSGGWTWIQNNLLPHSSGTPGHTTTEFIPGISSTALIIIGLIIVTIILAIVYFVFLKNRLKTA